MDTLQSYAKSLGAKLQEQSNMVTKKKIDSSEFDKTFIGRVTDRELVTYNNIGVDNQRDQYIKNWIVTAGGRNYKIKTENCNITALGQKVRVYIPNNNLDNAYAESLNPSTVPYKIVYKENDTNYNDYKTYGVDRDRNITENDVTIDSIVEYWKLADNTNLERLYLMTVINFDQDEEEVTNIICPDGKVINLEGFFVNA